MLADCADRCHARRPLAAPAQRPTRASTHLTARHQATTAHLHVRHADRPAHPTARAATRPAVVAGEPARRRPAPA
jgi:hypothetical protein